MKTETETETETRERERERSMSAPQVSLLALPVTSPSAARRSYNCHTAPITSLAFSVTDGYVMTGSEDGALLQWRVTSAPIMALGI